MNILIVNTFLAFLLLIECIHCNEGDAHKTSKLDYLLQHIFTRNKPEHAEQNNNVIINVDKPYTTPTFIELYVSGVQSYLSNDWTNCVYEIETALWGYKDYYAATASCRIICEHEGNKVSPFFEKNIENLHYYESVVRKTLCMEKCKRRLISTLPEYFHMNQWAQMSFMSCKPYEYLQLCYYRVSKKCFFVKL